MTFPTTQEIEIFAKEVFEVNKANGFCDTEFDIVEHCWLIVTELAEATEAHRNKIFADYSELATIERYAAKSDKTNFNFTFKECIQDTYECELADVLIRLLHLAERLKGLEFDLKIEIELLLSTSNSFLKRFTLSEFCMLFSKSLTNIMLLRNREKAAAAFIPHLINLILSYCYAHNIDVLAIAKLKNEYNKTRGYKQCTAINI